MSVQDKMLNIVQVALDEFNSPDYKLSSVLRKAIRIARLRNDYENLWWLEYEMISLWDETARERITKEILRHYSTDDFKRAQKGVLDAYIGSRKVQDIEDDESIVDKDNVCDMSIPDIEYYVEDCIREAEKKFPPQGMHSLDLYYAEISYTKTRTKLRFAAKEYGSVLSRVEHRVYEFLSTTEHQLVYGQINSDIFERNRRYVDARLHEIAPESLEQLVAAYRRSGEGETEARSHALLSCRRILKSFADKLYPPSAEPVEGPDGKTRKLTEEKYISRLWQFVAERVKGRTAGDLLLAQVSDLGNRIDRIYDLASKGVHADVSEFEVNQAVIQTYLLIGDILRLADQDSALYSEESA